MSNETSAQALERNLAHRRFKGEVMHPLTVRVPESAMTRLDDLCIEYKCMRGDLLRAMINREHEATFES